LKNKLFIREWYYQISLIKSFKLDEENKEFEFYFLGEDSTTIIRNLTKEEIEEVKTKMINNG